LVALVIYWLERLSTRLAHCVIVVLDFECLVRNGRLGRLLIFEVKNLIQVLLWKMLLVLSVR
jgi:hypothetical protein